MFDIVVKQKSNNFKDGWEGPGFTFRKQNLQSRTGGCRSKTNFRQKIQQYKFPVTSWRDTGNCRSDGLRKNGNSERSFWFGKNYCRHRVCCRESCPHLHTTTGNKKWIRSCYRRPQTGRPDDEYVREEKHDHFVVEINEPGAIHTYKKGKQGR